MGKAGEKQRRKPKISDKKQSELFKETTREVGADNSDAAFDEILEAMAGITGRKNPPKKS